MKVLKNDNISTILRLFYFLLIFDLSYIALSQSKLRTNVSSGEKKVITFNAFEKHKALKEDVQTKIQSRNKYRDNLEEYDFSEYVPEDYSEYYDGYQNLASYGELDEVTSEFDSLKRQPFEQVKKYYDLPAEMDSSTFYRAMDQYVFDTYDLSQYSTYSEKYAEIDDYDSLDFDQFKQDSLMSSYDISEDILLNHFSDNEWLTEMKQQETVLLSNFRNEDFLLKQQEYVQIDELSQEVSQAFETVKKKEEKRNFLRELINQKSPEFDSASAIQRFDGGGFMEVNENFKSIDMAPFIEYNITAKLLLGFGLNMQWALTDRPSLTSTSYRYYTEYRIKKFFIHAETESPPKVRSEQTTANTDTNYMMGVGRHFLIKKRVAGRIMLLMNLTDTTDQRFTLRYGFNIF